MKHTIENCVSSETLEVGGNARVDTKYALDGVIRCESRKIGHAFALALTLGEPLFPQKEEDKQLSLF